MRGESESLLLVSFFPPPHSLASLAPVLDPKVLYIRTTTRYPPLRSLLYPSPCLSPCVRPNHSYLPDPRVGFLFRFSVCLAASVLLLYLYACTRSYCRFYSHVCSSLHNRPTSFPCTPSLVSPRVSLSLACPQNRLSFVSRQSHASLLQLYSDSCPSIRIGQAVGSHPNSQEFDSCGERVPTRTPICLRWLHATYNAAIGMSWITIASFSHKHNITTLFPPSTSSVKAPTPRRGPVAASPTRITDCLAH